MSLRGKQKRFLRSKAHHLQPIFQIGKGGINSAMIVQIEEALEKRELIKVSLLQNTDEIAEETGKDRKEILTDFLCSKTGKALYDEKTKLWCNGPAYIAELYREELKKSGYQI